MQNETLEGFKGRPLKCRQWKAFQDILVSRSIGWHKKVLDAQRKNNTTENMLRVARRNVNELHFKLEEAKMREENLNRYQRKFVEKEQEIKDLKSLLENRPQIQKFDAEIQVSTSNPDFEQEFPEKLKELQLENERLQNLDKANKEQIAQIQEV